MNTHPGPEFETLLRAIAAGETKRVLDLVGRYPDLVGIAAREGATRACSTPHFLDEIGHYIYAGDTALHIAAAAHRADLVRRFLDLGADLHARNRHGAGPLHYAADGAPGLPRWDSAAQAATITCLIEAGADPNAADRRGVTPLHRAVRTRCAAAVQALLEGGADPNRRNRKGSTPMALTAWTTGRSGSGLAMAKAQLPEIVALLRHHGAAD
jgi:ankyrin repeat protein